MSPVLPPWQRRFTVLAPPTVVLLFVAVLLYTMLHRADSTRRVQATQALITRMHEVRTRMVDAETGQRGYIITGDSAYLAPHRAARRDVTLALGSLQQAFRGDTAQTRLLADARALVNERFRIMAMPLEKRAVSFEAARDQLIRGGGQGIMLQVRAVLDDMESLAQRRLQAEEAAQTRAGWYAILSLLLGAVVVAMVSRLTYLHQRRYADALRAANEGLASANAQLQEQALELEVQAEELQTQNQQLEDAGYELESANEELQQLNEMLEQRTVEAEGANRAKAQFLASMSHELRTPLNAIAGYVDLLDFGVYGEITEGQRNCLVRIQHNGRHLLVLIDDILNFAKVQAGKIELQLHDVQLRDVVREAAEMLHPIVQNQNMQLVTRVEADGAHVHGDPARIRQILLNLVSNAVKYTADGGVVELIATADDTHARLHVRDHGRGIPAEMIEAIFDPFVQVPRDGGVVEGVGLGLSISRELARAMHGDLAAETEPGQGSTFTLTLPRTPVAVPAHPQEAPVSV